MSYPLLNSLHTTISGAHAANTITCVPTGNIVSTTVQGAINEITTLIKNGNGLIGDIIPKQTLWIFPGDSTTQQAGGSGYLFDTLTTEYRNPAGSLNEIVGYINMGASGYKLSSWVNDALGTLPSFSTSNLGVGNKDYYGHTNGGSISLNTAISWRSSINNNTHVVWAPCFGINDCILDASVGNLTESQISNYISNYLKIAILRILSYFPNDKILLRIPNPMTARPYNAGAGYPSPTQYPTFGQNDAIDQALVEKWNQGIRNGHLALQGFFNGVQIYDKWELVYGPSDTISTVSNLPFLGNLVHPGEKGYKQEAHTIIKYIAPNNIVKPRQLTGRHAWAEEYGAVRSKQPWEQWPPYLDNNCLFELIATGTLSAKGSTYFDISEVNYANFKKLAKGRGIFVQIGNAVGQSFPAYTALDNTSSIRFINVTPSSAFQSYSGGLPTVRIYSYPLVQKVYSGCGLTQNGNRIFIPVLEEAPNGGTFSAYTGNAVPATVSLSIYTFAENQRTLLGTITITANSYNATMSSGNPTTTIPAGHIFEAEVTSATYADKQVFAKFTVT